MVRSHRCPATVSGSKSAETTEVSCLGKVQRVGQCREPGDLSCLALRRPFEGKGRRLLYVDPNRSDWGFFMRVAPFFSHVCLLQGCRKARDHDAGTGAVCKGVVASGLSVADPPGVVC